MLRIRSTVVLLASTIVLLAAPAAARAATWCVNDAACVAAGGTDQPTIPAAVGEAATNPGDDTIKIGAKATPYVLGSTLTTGALEHLTIEGAGPLLTLIQQPAGANGLSMRGASPTIRNVGFMSMASAGIAHFPLAIWAETGSYVVENVTVVGDGLAGVQLSSTGTVTGLAVDLPLATPLAPYSRAVAMTGTPGSTAVLNDLQLKADVGVDNPSPGIVRISRASIRATLWGIYAHVGNTSSTSQTRISSTLIRMLEPDLTGAETMAIRAEVANNTNPSTLDVDASGLTIVASPIGSSGTDQVMDAHTSGGAGDTATLDVDIDGLVTWGTFDREFRSSATGANVASVHVTNSVYESSDDVPNGVGSITHGDNVRDRSDVAGPYFLDAVAHDYRVRWGSPLVDVGSASPLNWESTSDLGGGARVVGAKQDIGAYEYQRRAPVVLADADRTVQPGAAVSLTATATDADPGETATLAYAWSLPGGGASSVATASFTAPTAPGTYVATVSVTDVSGAVTTEPVSITVPAPPVVVDKVAPVVRFFLQKLSFAKLQARKPFVSVFTVNEPARVKASLVATVLNKRIGKPGYVKSTVVLGTTTTKLLPKGKRSVTIAILKARLATYNKLRTRKGAKVSYTVVGTATDAAKNVRRLAVKVTLVK